ncbi:MAG: DUF1835 domain-containing protein [Vicinamibacterales bacterium]
MYRAPAPGVRLNAMLHVTNGDSARELMERSGVPGSIIVWPDVLHEGPTPLLAGDEWNQLRSRYLASHAWAGAETSFDEVLREYRERDAALESYAAHDEVVFWFEHDLFDQLLLIRHLWWLSERRAEGAKTAFSLVCGNRHLGLLEPQEFPPLFAARAPITAVQIAVGADAWRAFCADDPIGLLSLAAAKFSGSRSDHDHDHDHAPLPYLTAAIRRHLEEFPSVRNGLARSEEQILRVLADGDRTPEEAFMEASRLEDHLFMGDMSFWTIVGRLARVARPLVDARVEPRPGRLPTGTLTLTSDGAAVLSGRADHVALNGPDRWLGGTHLTPARFWRWTGTTLEPAS